MPLLLGIGGALNIGASDIADTDTLNTNGILTLNSRSSVTVGDADWGTNSTDAADGTIVAYTNYNTGAEDTWTTANNFGNVSVANSAAMLGSRTINTLKLSASTSGQSLDLGRGNTLQLNSGGVVFSSANNYSISNGTIEGGQATTSDLLFVTGGAGELTVGSTIANGNGASRLMKSGSGTLVINGQNTYTGTTYVVEGTLKLGSSTIRDGTTPVTVGVSGPLGTGNADLVMRGGELDLNGQSLGVRVLTGMGNDVTWVTNNNASTPGKIVIGYNNPGNWGAGVLIKDGAGVVAVEKVGTTQWQINNGNNTFTGGFTLSGGSVRNSVNGTIGTGTLTMNGGDSLVRQLLGHCQ